MELRVLDTRLEQARKLGARGVELLFEAREGTAVELVRGRPVSTPIPATETLSVRVWRDGGRTGHAVGAPAPA
ncbi:MAG: hypothetical protein ABMA64_26385, partial [Myxococcota bacterium]